MSTGKVILGTMAGVAIGALAGILFAPEKGSTTRKNIKDKYDDYIDELKSRFQKCSDSIKENLENANDVAEEIVDKGKAKFEEAKTNFKNATM